MKKGNNCVVGSNVIFDSNVEIGHNCIFEDDIKIGNNVTIDCNVIIRSGTVIGDGSYIGANSIIGEASSGMKDSDSIKNKLVIGKNALIRSGAIIYSNSTIGDNFQTGHRVTIREKSVIGNHVSVGTLSDIQGSCTIGNYVRMHSNVHIGQLSVIDDFVWIYPYVVLTNDPTPPSEKFVGVHVCSFAIIATGSIIMPGLTIGTDSLVGAGAIVTRSVNQYEVVVGNPAKPITDIRNVKSKFTGEPVYPWREHFKRYMPWEESDFENWYKSLSIEEQNKLGI